MVNVNLTGPNPTQQTVPNYTTRLDHVFDEKNRAYFRFTDIRQQQQALRNYPSASPANIETAELKAGSTGYQQIPVQTISGAIGYSKTFSPTFFSETIASMQWQRMYVQGNEVSLGNFGKQFGLPNNFGNVGFPDIGANLFMPYGGSQWYYGMSQRVSTLDENLNKVWGKHQLAFGFRFRHERFAYLSDRSPDQVAFSTLATSSFSCHISQIMASVITVSSLNPICRTATLLPKALCSQFSLANPRFSSPPLISEDHVLK
jgi:hypothetical protein